MSVPLKLFSHGSYEIAGSSASFRNLGSDWGMDNRQMTLADPTSATPLVLGDEATNLIEGHLGAADFYVRLDCSQLSMPSQGLERIPGTNSLTVARHMIHQGILSSLFARDLLGIDDEVVQAQEFVRGFDSDRAKPVGGHLGERALYGIGRHSHHDEVLHSYLLRLGYNEEQASLLPLPGTINDAAKGYEDTDRASYRALEVDAWETSETDDGSPFQDYLSEIRRPGVYELAPDGKSLKFATLRQGRIAAALHTVLSSWHWQNPVYGALEELSVPVLRSVPVLGSTTSESYGVPGSAFFEEYSPGDTFMTSEFAYESQTNGVLSLDLLRVRQMNWRLAGAMRGLYFEALPELRKFVTSAVEDDVWNESILRLPARSEKLKDLGITVSPSDVVADVPIEADGSVINYYPPEQKQRLIDPHCGEGEGRLSDLSPNFAWFYANATSPPTPLMVTIPFRRDAVRAFGQLEQTTSQGWPEAMARPKMDKEALEIFMLRSGAEFNARASGTLVD